MKKLIAGLTPAGEGPAARIERALPELGRPPVPFDASEPAWAGKRHRRGLPRLEVAPGWFQLESYAVPMDGIGWSLALDQLSAYSLPDGYVRWAYDRAIRGPLIAWAASQAQAIGLSLTRRPRPAATDSNATDEPEVAGADQARYEDAAVVPIPTMEALNGTIADRPLAGRELLLVDRHAYPEAMLMEQFKAWVIRTRLPGQVPGGKRGPQAMPNAAFGASHFDAWHKQRIVPYFELALWADRHGLALTDEAAWRLLFPEAAATGDVHQVAHVRKTLARALSDRSVLGNQVRAQFRME